MSAPAEPKSTAQLSQRKFAELAAQWKKETVFHSAMAQIAAHPAYQRILGFGPSVLPFIFADLKKRPALWFHALQELTGANPVPPEDRGVIEKMRAAWLQWGQDHGYDV